MRRFLLITITLMMTICMMAVGLNDGSKKANAIDFRWGDGHDHQAGATLWYRVDLDSISGLADPTLALYLTNMSDNASKVTVDVSATISVSTPFFTYSVDTAVVKDESCAIAARDYKLLSKNVKMLLEMNVRYLYLELHSEQNIKLSAKKYETSDIVDDACTKAKDFNWNGVAVPAGETWYRLNLAEVKTLNKELDFVVTNTASAQAEVKFDLSLDCPASTIFPYSWTIPAGEAMTEEFGRIFIDELNDDYVYLKLATDKALELKVAEKPAPPVVVETWNVAENLVEGQSYTISGETVFEIDMATLSAPRGMRAEFVVTNLTANNDTLTQQLSFANPVKNIIEKQLPVAANSSVTKEVVNNMAGVINSDKVFVRFATKGAVAIQLNYVVVNQEVVDAKPVVLPTCENSELLDWNSVVKQKGLENKWYEIDLASVKQNDKHLQLTFTNKSNNLVVVMGEIRSNCETEDAIPYVLPLQSGQTLSQVINYNLFALLPHPEHFYVSAMVIPTTATSLMDLKDVRSKDDIMAMVPKDMDAIQAAEVELVANAFSAVADPTDCNQAVTIAKGVKYEQAAGTTKWYRVTDELLNQLSLIPNIAFINNGKSAANITMAAGVDCEHSTFALTTISVPTWADMTLFPSRLIGNVLDKAFNGDVTEMYLQVTTDQPIAFGIDIDYGFGLGCDDARKFNWETGTTVLPGDAQWLEFDITSVKANEQQVKLTLTNESNSLAWVGMMVSLTCPFDVALPLVFPIPAGASVDKVVDYSYFASTKLDQLYIALITEEKVSVKATAVKATASTSDLQACENAVVVENGGTYTHKPGTAWYKFDRSLFNDVSRMPKFRYAAEGTTNVTLGATVGCEYNIATRATIKLPTTKGIEVSFRTPGFIYDLIKKFVHKDVDAYYVELTTDQTISFGLDMEYAGGCEQATKLDLTQPLDIDLKANEDVWYTVDLKEVRAMGDKMISFSLNNPSDEAVEVEFELTPTCPLVVSAIKSINVPAGVNLPLMFKASTITNLYDQVIAKFNVPEKITNNLPSQLQDDLIYYVRVRAKGDLSIGEGDSIPEVVESGCDMATPLDITQEIDVEKLAKGWYVVDLTGINKDFSLKFINNTGLNQTLDFQFYSACDEDEAKMLENYLTSYKFVVPTTGFEQKVPYSMISSYLTISELYIYVNKEEGGEIDMACASALLLDFANPLHLELEEGKEQWYKIAVKNYENFDKNLVINTKNLSGKQVKIEASLATSCPALVTIDTSLVVNSGLNRVDSITAGMINMAWEQYGDKVAGIDTAYIRLLANGHLVLDVDTFTVEAPEVPAGCEEAAELDFSKTINLSELKTGWYHVDLTPLKNGVVTKLSVNNDLGKETGVKFDIFRNCEEGSFLYTYTQAFNVGLFEQSIPSSLVGMLGSLNELYIYITVGVDILTCEDAIEFDWTKGAIHQADDTQWYHFDITSVKTGEQQVKLTFTNHSSEMAIVYGEVALHCPYTYSIPYACVVPAGMSIDKVVDYSVFASSRVEEMYVKVHSTETIELAASSESALVFDNTPCENATVVASGVKYTQQAGTSWYKFTKDLFKNTGKLPKLYFTTLEEGLTTITMGATVGCEYNIATKTIVKLPGSWNYAVVVPEQLFDLMDKMVNDEVTEVYVELTTDRAVTMSVDMINDTDDPCHGAELLDVTKGINLTANQDKWYKVDLDALKAMNSDVAVTVLNPSAEPATVDMELSLTCPVVVSVNKSMTVPAQVGATKIISQSTLAKIPGVSFYVRLRSTQDIQIIFSEPEVPEDVDACETAIEYIWGTDVVVDTTSWYKVSIVDVRNQDCSITLTVTNNSADTVKADLSLYESCDATVAFATLKNVGIAPNSTRSKTIASDELPADIDTLYLYTHPYGELTINLSPDCPVFKTVYDTIASYACGTEVLTWNDTVHVSKYLDSVYTYVVTPLVAPTKMNDSILATIAGAIPTLTPGTTPDMTASADSIKAYYSAHDNEATADVVKVEWTVSPIACGVTTHTMTLTIEDECGTAQTADYALEVTVPALVVVNETVTICESALPYTWEGNTYPAGTHTIMKQNVNGCDSAQINLTIELYPAIPETVITDTICYGESYTWNLKQQTYSATVKDTAVIASVLTGCDSVVILDLTVLPEIITYDTVRVSENTIYNWVEAGMTCKKAGDYQATLTSVYGCDSVANLHVIWVPKVVENITDTICDGTGYMDPYTNKEHIISSLVPAAQTWSDTVAVTEADIFIYNFAITPIVAPEEMTDAVLKTIPGATPVLTPGMLPDVAGTIDAIKAYYNGVDTETIADVDSVYWTDASLATVVACGTTTHTMTLVVVAGCDNKITTTHVLDVDPTTQVTIVNDTVCFGETYLWSVNGQSYTGTTTDTVTFQNVYGCDSVVVLELFERPAVAVTTVNDTVCYGESYVWSVNGQSYTGTTTDTVTLPNVYGCDSVVVLELFERPEVILPEVTIDDIIAICGNAIDVDTADSILRAYMATDPLLPALEDVDWEILNADGNWTPLTKDAIDGLVSTVTLRYTVQTACEDVSDTIVVTVQTPTPENDDEMKNVPAFKNYGDRLLTVSLKYIKEVFGWDVAEEDVTWYLKVEGGVDVEKGKGYYLTTVDGTSLPAGTYYARINHTAVDAADCDGILQTEPLTVEANVEGPKLIPTIAKPNELIRVLNLNADAVSTISVYSAAGELIQTFHVENQDNTTFKASQLTGYYVVEVQTETEKVSLRYIVK